MTLDDLNRRINLIAEYDRKRDFEAAHSEEDKMRADALCAIADGAVEGCTVETFAAVALVSNPNSNPRW